VTHIQTLLRTLLAEPACRALGWALLHFLWQGTLAALLLAACNFALRDWPASVRYAVSCLFLMVLLALPVLTFAAFLGQEPAPAATQVRLTLGIPTAAPLALPSNGAADLAVPRPSIQEALTPFLPWIVALWIAGVILLSMRCMAAWTYLLRLRRDAGLPVPPEWERALRSLMRRAAIAIPVRLSIPRMTQAPCVIGWLRPVILMPPASLIGLDWRALEALLAHELAHIRRHDYLVNLAQTVVDTLLFYHPAVWWVSRQIRIERENCCDDFAAQLCGGRVTYARALVDLEQIRAAEPAFAMSARGGSLMHRIQRLLSPRDQERRGPAWLPALAGVAVVASLALALHSPVQAERTTSITVPAARPQAIATPLPAAPRKPIMHAVAAAQDSAASPAALSAAPPKPSHDFLTGIVAAGFHNLTVDELIELKIQGVTPEFAAAVKQSGYSNVTASELVEMAIHGVDMDFMRAMKDGGLDNLSVADLVRLRIHGVDAAFIRHLKETGIKNVSVEQLVRLRQAGF
jgi:beta-lactamase regulating signal transducer with metallopeptidase domain